MENINDLQAGKAGEYLVCADLIINGMIAFPSEQGLPFDVVLEYNNKLLKVQVKTTRCAKNILQRKNSIPAYIFHIGNNGKNNRRKQYDINHVDIFALVCLENKTIAYLPHKNIRTTMNFRVPKYRGKYHDEQSVQIKEQVIKLKKLGWSAVQISNSLKMKLSNVYKYSANVSLKQNGTNSGVYFDVFTLEKCLNEL